MFSQITCKEKTQALALNKIFNSIWIKSLLLQLELHCGQSTVCETINV